MAYSLHKRRDFDFNENLSSVVKPITIRVIFTIAITHKWSIQQLYVNNAFLNELLDEKVYMDQHQGFKGSNTSLVCKLKKALHDLKQASYEMV